MTTPSIDFEQTIQAGSKSFSFAARFFDRQTYQAVIRLYAWCRTCDDWVDQAGRPADAADQLLQWTEDGMKGLAVPAPFAAFGEIARSFQIPDLYPLELLEGMKFDATGGQVRTEADLHLYCYRVAGVVGLMMCHIMGVRRDSALRSAVDTGLAMQMTNISRDVKDDFAMGRIYIPDEWFEKRRPLRARAFDPKDFVTPVQRLVEEADLKYQSGRAGLDSLPWAASLAVGSAQLIYREIGVEVVRRGLQAWDERVVIPKSKKILLLGRHLTLTLPLQISMAFRKFQKTRHLPVIGPNFSR